MGWVDEARSAWARARVITCEDGGEAHGEVAPSATLRERSMEINALWQSALDDCE